MDEFVWCIDVHVGTVGQQAYCKATSGAERVAMWASKAYPDVHVTLSAMARTRRVYMNGAIIKDNPDISVFYDNCTSQEQHLWKDVI
jgi:hypothetical protein